MSVQLAEYYIDMLEFIDQLYGVDEFYMRVCNLKDLILQNDPTYKETYFIACFIQGLKSDIKEYVLNGGPRTLNSAHELALHREQELKTDSNSRDMIAVGSGVHNASGEHVCEVVLNVGVPIELASSHMVYTCFADRRVLSVAAVQTYNFEPTLRRDIGITTRCYSLDNGGVLSNFMHMGVRCIWLFDPGISHYSDITIAGLMTWIHALLNQILLLLWSIFDVCHCMCGSTAAMKQGLASGYFFPGLVVYSRAIVFSVFALSLCSVEPINTTVIDAACPVAFEVASKKSALVTISNGDAPILTDYSAGMDYYFYTTIYFFGWEGQHAFYCGLTFLQYGWGVRPYMHTMHFVLAMIRRNIIAISSSVYSSSGYSFLRASHLCCIGYCFFNRPFKVYKVGMIREELEAKMVFSSIFSWIESPAL